MGEAFVCCEDVDIDEAESMDTHRPTKEATTCASVGVGVGVGIKWERFLPKMMLRVLVVEADDSTRQIITALLRKCCYRVAAVPDGLKAWEILKERPRNVDLILAEVELPSISGFALLTLIMEHETCKNIPVIMMSSEDSISTVYKCMMKGAADYLLKPLRRNELRNLWQHVWRRQASCNVRNDVQEKVEVTSENETASYHSTGCVAGVQRNNKNIEKGSDTQSSCTKVDFEVGSRMQEFSQPSQGKASAKDFKMQKDEGHINLSQRLVMHENEAGGLAMGCYENSDLPITLSMGLEPMNDRVSPSMANEAGNNKDSLANPSSDAATLNHACTTYVDNYQRSSPSTNAAKNNFSSALHLDLSLRRCQPNDFENCSAEGRATLKHSSASAFTRYTYRPLQTLQAKSGSICDEQKEFESNPEGRMFDIGGSTGATSTSDTINPTQSLQKNSTSMPPITGQSNQSEIAKSCSSETVIPLQVSVKDLMSNNQCSGYGSLLSPNFCTHLGPSSSPCPALVTHPEPIFANHNLEQFLNQHHSVSNATNWKIENPGKRLESAENEGHISPTTDHSANSSLCGGGNTTHVRSAGYASTCGSNSNVDRVGIPRITAESKHEEALFSQGVDSQSHRSSQREAALTKFRLKRKDRCYEKKVRYESRKKLAEQRPRVKGQFVRRVFTDPLLPESNGNMSNA